MNMLWIFMRTEALANVQEDGREQRRTMLLRNPSTPCVMREAREEHTCFPRHVCRACYFTHNDWLCPGYVQEWFTRILSSVWISQPVFLCRMCFDVEHNLTELQQQQGARTFNCKWNKSFFSSVISNVWWFCILQTTCWWTNNYQITSF